jgi:hypothetical protein
MPVPRHRVLAIGLSRRKPLKFPNIGANCPSKLRGEALALPRDAAFWTAALHSTGEGPVPGHAPPNQAYPNPSALPELPIDDGRVLSTESSLTIDTFSTAEASLYLRT